MPGTYPEIAWDAEHHVAANVGVPGGSTTAITSKSEAAGQTPSWDSTMYGLGGDSGSWAYTFDDKLIGVHYADGWMRKDSSSPYYSDGLMLPFDELMKKINTGRAKPLSACTTNTDKTI
jgi:hypothetical protein